MDPCDPDIDFGGNILVSLLGVLSCMLVCVRSIGPEANTENREEYQDHECDHD